MKTKLTFKSSTYILASSFVLALSIKTFSQQMPTHLQYIICLPKLVKINGGRGLPRILVDAGIHAREWISPAATLFFMERLARVIKRWGHHVVFKLLLAFTFLDSYHRYKSPFPSLIHWRVDWLIESLMLLSGCHVITIRKHGISLYKPLLLALPPL